MMSKNIAPKMSVKKSQDKADKKSISKSEQSHHESGITVFGTPSANGKVYQSPLNDSEEYKNVDSAEVSVAFPTEDGSIPTWRNEKNGRVLPMVKTRKDDGSFEFRPRKKKGPAKGKQYKPRAAKVQQLMMVADQTNGVLSVDNMLQLAQSAASPKLAATDAIMGEMTEGLTAFDAVDYQALVHAWQMKSIGALDQREFMMIKTSIFEKRQNRALMSNVSPDMESAVVVEAPEMTF